MYKNVKRGWYKLLNPKKFKRPIDSHMNSFNESVGSIEYKSSLELKAFRYSDFNKFITSWSIEPFPIKYRSPKDGKIHRYFIDMFLEFNTGDKFLVEIKPKSQTVPPQKPKKNTRKSAINYQKASLTFAINQAKWAAAREFGAKNKMKFITLTEEELK